VSNEVEMAWKETGMSRFTVMPFCLPKEVIPKRSILAEHIVFSLFRHTRIRIDNSVVLVRKRTIPTERPQPVGEVSANFS
jgi:hypothetical protein